ncbi:hypothetical protein FGRMN_7163 [Fusarium graminum]|nr:hypothetical protein FGRMN_7163 [Fusarium graminum]
METGGETAQRKTPTEIPDSPADNQDHNATANDGYSGAQLERSVKLMIQERSYKTCARRNISQMERQSWSRLCTRIRNKRDLVAHHRDAHSMQCDCDPFVHLSRRENKQVKKWHTDIFNSRMPTWPPIDRQEMVQTMKG